MSDMIEPHQPGERESALQALVEDQSKQCLGYLILLASPEDYGSVMSSGRICEAVLGSDAYKVLTDYQLYCRDRLDADAKGFVEYQAAHGKDIQPLMTPQRPLPTKISQFWDVWSQLSERRKNLQGAQFCREVLNEFETGKPIPEDAPEKMREAITPTKRPTEWTQAEFEAECAAIYQEHANPGALYVPTGLHDLDLITHGCRRGEMMVIAGRPGTGKTMMATTIASYHSIKRKWHVAFVSSEMTRRQIVERIILGTANMSFQTRQDGEHIIVEPSINAAGIGTTAQEVAWSRAAQKANDLLAGQDSYFTLYADDVISISDVEAFVREQVYRGKIDILIVDYAQNLVGGRGHSNWEQVADVSKRFKVMAKTYNIAIIVLSQLRRTQSNTDQLNAHPGLDDLANSDELGRLAATVCCLSHYKAVQPYGSTEPFRHFSACEVVKNRYGKQGLIETLPQGTWGIITEVGIRQDWPEKYQEVRKKGGAK